VKNTFLCKKNTINVQGNIISLDVPLVMGIVNATPDSFYDGNAQLSLEIMLAQVARYLTEGARIIDVGGYSTRPNAAEVSVAEELTRVIPIIEAIVRQFPGTVISIDTFRAEVARKAVLAGAAIVNDISAGELDENMFDTVAALAVPYMMMHTRGTPTTMQTLTAYTNLAEEIISYFEPKINKLKALGVKDIIIDPGFGFAKTLDQNYELLQKLPYFKVLECPVLVGVSRKSMIYKQLNTSALEALNGTTALHAMALMLGAAIIRVHDVKEAVETVHLFQKMKMA
jgi:dihydropteroate synthase